MQIIKRSPGLEAEYTLLVIYDTLSDQIGLLEPDSSTVILPIPCYYKSRSGPLKHIDMEGGRILRATDRIIGKF